MTRKSSFEPHLLEELAHYRSTVDKDRSQIVGISLVSINGRLKAPQPQYSYDYALELVKNDQKGVT